MAEPPYAAVYFDCDSTLSAIEGVDELLQFAEPAARAGLVELTEAAMNGTVALAAVYERRLALLRPRREHLRRVAQLYLERLVPDAAATVAALRSLGKHVGIVSGGMLEPVRAVAAALGMPAANVHAVDVHFAADGSYLDFDRGSPLWRNGGKAAVLRALPPGHRPVAFVGDGFTDLETQGTAARFVGFGGVARREAVAARAERYVAHPSLAAVLPHLLDAAEITRLLAAPQSGALRPHLVGP